MERIAVAFVKPICLALICAVSVYYLAGSMSAAIVISLIPLLLGWLGIMQGFAYGLAALAFLAATAWAVIPAETKTYLRDQTRQAVEVASQELNKEIDKAR
ncbi:hypothetical protein [Methylobacterium sp. E-045]|jgi:uncharacterized membrane protein required for colicin V production|uniref:hypothetical protein n=1 Tax=Methylobacterium sp. E-045 TaxID=2836575 RepID=UPI001FBB411D|nr:hypothetical protein [Methylobacterium sp. E-045]MCJ2129918.1 hypothetical protein [Methylobacterium sp. E-045]